MATALSLAELRRLGRLHRAGVDGAHEQLEYIIELMGEELPALLHFSAAKLPRLREHPDPVELLLALIDARGSQARDSLRQQQRDLAVRLGLEAAHTAVRYLSGEIELDAASVEAVCCACSGGYLVFGRRGGVEVRRLRALLKECRTLPIQLSVTGSVLNLRWSAGSSRGNFKLTLWPMVDDDAVVIPLPDLEDNVHEVQSPVDREATPLTNTPPEAVIERHAAQTPAPLPEHADSGAQERHRPVPGWARLPRDRPRAVAPPRGPAVRGSRKRGIAMFIDALSSAMAGAR